MEVPPGPLSAKTAKWLTELGRRVGASLRVWGVPPITVTRGGDGQVSIGMVANRFEGCVVRLRDATQTIANSTITRPNWAEVVDTANYFDSATPDRFTVPIGGVYLVGATAYWDLPSATSYRLVGASQFGGSASATGEQHTQVLTYIMVKQSVSTLVSMLDSGTATGVLQAYVSQDQGSNTQLIQSNTFAWVHRVG